MPNQLQAVSLQARHSTLQMKLPFNQVRPKSKPRKSDPLPSRTRGAGSKRTPITILGSDDAEQMIGSSKGRLDAFRCVLIYLNSIVDQTSIIRFSQRA